MGANIWLAVAAGGALGAHAWLVCGEQVVTGGEIERYAVMLSEDAADDFGKGTDESPESVRTHKKEPVRERDGSRD